MNKLNCCVFSALTICKYKMCVMPFCKLASVIFGISYEFFKSKRPITSLKYINAYCNPIVIDGQNNFEFVFHLQKSHVNWQQSGSALLTKFVSVKYMPHCMQAGLISDYCDNLDHQNFFAIIDCTQPINQPPLIA